MVIFVGPSTTAQFHEQHARSETDYIAIVETARCMKTLFGPPYTRVGRETPGIELVRYNEISPGEVDAVFFGLYSGHLSAVRRWCSRTPTLNDGHAM